VSAVRMHGVADEECPPERRDHLWQILKDADGLERGRFGWPGSEERGCSVKMLRLEYLGSVRSADSARTYLPWMAYQLSRITRYSQWDAFPCRRLLTDFYLGLKISLSHHVLPNRDIPVAQELLLMLATLCEDIAMSDLTNRAEAEYAEYEKRAKEERRLYRLEQKHAWRELLTSDQNDWDDHDLDWEAYDWESE